jgi:hypothetical protein
MMYSLDIPKAAHKGSARVGPRLFARRMWDGTDWTVKVFPDTPVLSHETSLENARCSILRERVATLVPAADVSPVHSYEIIFYIGNRPCMPNAAMATLSMHIVKHEMDRRCVVDPSSMAKTGFSLVLGDGRKWIKHFQH